MKRIISIIAVALMAAGICSAADNNTKNDNMNSSADNILGNYLIVDEDGTSHAKVCKAKDGSYYCQTYGGKPILDKDGSVMLDKFNQNAEYAKMPVHEAIIIFGLQYDPAKKVWTNGKIHHPFKRMLKANCDAYFVGDGKTLCIFGNVAGMGAKRFWTKQD